MRRSHQRHPAGSGTGGTLPANGTYTIASLPADGHWWHGVAGVPEVPSGDFGAWLLGAGNNGIPIVGDWCDNRASTDKFWDFQPGGNLASWQGHCDVACGGLYQYGQNTGELAESWKAVATGTGAVWQQWHDRTVASITAMKTYWGSRTSTLYIRPFHEWNGGWEPWSLKAKQTEVEVVTVSNATGGTFTLTYGGQTTGAIAYNATAATVQTALQGLSSVGAGNMTVSGSAGSYTITFAGTLAYTLVASPITVSGTSLTGSSPTVAVTVQTPGVEPQEGYMKTVWQMWSTLCRSIFPAAKILFNVNATTPSGMIDWRMAFPGTSYVDYLSVDYYNAWEWTTDQASFDLHKSDTHWYKDPSQSTYPPRGPEAYRAWAEAQGIGIVFSEWGNPAFNGKNTNGTPYSPAEGGDAPGFFDAFYAWLQTHGGNGAGKVLYEVLFNVPNYNSGSLEYTIWMNKIPGTTSPLPAGSATTKQPLSQARYKALWSVL